MKLLHRLFSLAPYGFLALMAFPASAAEGKSIWDGAYTEAQAARGKSAYNTSCAGCHREDLTGYQGVLNGNRFWEHWREDSLKSFFNVTKMTMPRGAPRSLTDQQYLDIVAYVLQVNGLPAGNTELTSSLLEKTQLIGKEGPQPVPDSSLVEVVGCLSQQPDKAWVLTRASEPVRTREPGDTGKAELAAVSEKSLGTHQFHFLEDPSIAFAPHGGHKVEAKGFLIRKPGDDRINITSVQTLASSCGQ